MKDLSLAAKAALLHDIGKVCIRATGERQNHSVLGADFLRSFLGESKENQQLIRCVRYHHADQMKMTALEQNDLAYIVYEADNIASGLDRREKEENGDTAFGFDSSASLENIFNLFDGDGGDSYFPLQELNADKNVNFPKANGKPVATQGGYARLLEVLKENFQKRKLEDMSPNELLRILEDTVIYVPSSTNKREVCDISLYDHVKITAAIATSLLRYFDNHDIQDYQDFCWKNAKENRSKKTMLFVSGDFSGIQKFIYRVQTKGAMRMLRGRSFYLDIALENIVDELLEKLSLCRANLIYCGGGHFYFLADNSDATKDILRKGFNEVNRKLAEMFSASLYLAFAWEEICAEDLLVREVWRGKNIFQKVGEKLSLAKQKRYDEETLAALFDPASSLNAVGSDSRECGLCHRSADGLKPYRAQENYGEEDSLEVCEICNGLYQLGKNILNHKTLFAIVNGEEKNRNDGIEVPTPFGKKYLLAVNKNELDALHNGGSLVRIYEKNRSSTSEKMASRLWIGDYAAERNNTVLEISDLAEMAGGENSATGIKRLGVLRADVDNLGAAFIAGLRKANLPNPDCYATLSRYSALSRQMSMFFKRIIVDVCRKQLPEGLQPFYMFQDKGKAERLLHIIYSGGDDLFLVGAWDDLLEFAVDLRKTFNLYTNGKLSFSAGLGLFGGTYPVSRMAEDTGKLEDAAKESDGKDSIALFGESTEYRGENKRDAVPVFKWKAFEENVCNEKLRFLLNHFAMEGITEDTGENLRVGKSLLYRLLTLLAAPRSGNFNLARFAYTIARLEPDKRNAKRLPCYHKVREKLFGWAREEKSKRELITAIRLLIYRLRDKQEEEA